MEKELNQGQICSICGNPIDGYGHNSQPVKDGRCCDKCNEEVVIVRWREFYQSVMKGEL